MRYYLVKLGDYAEVRRTDKPLKRIKSSLELSFEGEESKMVQVYYAGGKVLRVTKITKLPDGVVFGRKDVVRLDSETAKKLLRLLPRIEYDW